MFTGLIQETGRVVAMVHPGNGRATRISIAAKSIPSQLKTGDSVAVSGVCLTAVDAGRGQFSADLSAETLARTSLGSLQPGSVVNMELPAKAGDRLGGHIVQGHVDGVGKLLRLEKIKDREDWRLTISLPPALRKYVVPQGSITIEGISLTVAGVRAGVIEIAIIPHTYTATNLHRLRAGSTVNVETDVLSKYAGKGARRKTSSKLTVVGLIKKGF
ncbi:MAG TPA: riboflavin synthase [Verrucomicrobiae bacterium]|jgi:riboflavin synthase|nr:riboflavin synthase [Verrucomicrobiae bacterium]